MFWPLYSPLFFNASASVEISTADLPEALACVNTVCASRTGSLLAISVGPAAAAAAAVVVANVPTGMSSNNVGRMGSFRDAPAQFFFLHSTA